MGEGCEVLESIVLARLESGVASAISVDGSGALSANGFVKCDLFGEGIMHSGIAQSGIFISTCLGVAERELCGRVSGDADKGALKERGEPLPLENDPEEPPELGSESSDTYEYSSGITIGMCFGRDAILR